MEKELRIGDKILTGPKGEVFRIVKFSNTSNYPIKAISCSRGIEKYFSKEYAEQMKIKE